MSRFITHINGLERRIGKKVKVNSSDIFDVTRNEEGTLMVGPYRFTSQYVLDAFLQDHTIAAAGYTRDCGCSKGYTEDVKDVPLNTQVEVLFKNYTELGWVSGEFSYSQTDGSTESKLYFLSDCPTLDGSIAVDKKGYMCSWAMAKKGVKELCYPVKIRSVFTNGKEGTWSLEDECKETHEVYGKLKYNTEDNEWILLTNDEVFDGHSTSKRFKEGYKYSWWICDGKVCTSGGYKLKYIRKDKPKAEAELTKHAYIMDTPCMVGTKLHGLVEGMLVFQEGDYYILTNDSEYSGAPAPDKKGYKYSWVVGDETDAKSLGLKTETFEESSKDVAKDPLVRIAMALEDIATSLSRMSK